MIAPLLFHSASRLQQMPIIGDHYNYVTQVISSRPNQQYPQDYNNRRVSHRMGGSSVNTYSCY